MATFSENNPLVYTVRNLCKVCYTCVRECPVKAIKIINGQAEVITNRCIACGNCVMVCSQNAKVYFRSGEAVMGALKSTQRTIACIAPSFPAEFTDISDYKILVGMIRKLGFDVVTEVSFGADLVAKEYAKIFDNPDAGPVITSDCPAIVNYIKHYHPGLVRLLAPIFSPAMAMAEVVKEKYGEDANIIFIGPCIAKKAESDSFYEVLTFAELRELFKIENITPHIVESSDFDPPFSGRGAFFPVNHGLLKSVNKFEGIGKGEVITAEGKSKFMEAIRNFENDILSNQHLELLCCDGCIHGPGMTKRGDQFIKRKKISEYVTQKMGSLETTAWEADLNEYSGVDLTRRFIPDDRRISEPIREKVRKVLVSMGRTASADMLNCGACGYETCEDHAIAVVEGLAETEMCLPYAIEKLHESVYELNKSNRKLADTRQALKQSEKLASMGQVSAGIAHELNNPLGIITLYSSILKDEISKESPVYDDISIIDEQAERCKKIVSGLLNFARKNQVKLKECNIIDFVNHSIKSLIVPGNISIHIEHDLSDPVIRIDDDQMMQVLTNLLRNAIEAMVDGGKLTIGLEHKDGEATIIIADTGVGISSDNIEKIFTPFFTTKGSGKGTGLGLPLAYGIVKMHKGKISVSSNDNPQKGPTGTKFIISIPQID
ncbi:MAG: 4Fe-4S binding protein [Bacteroidales bacterium]|nr:4Fe-4S binding protein [Bacteroidales bacterium]